MDVVTGRAFGQALAEVILMGCGVVVGGGILLEGAALSGAKALKDNQATAAKMAKCALAAIALIGAMIISAGVSFVFFGLLIEGLSLTPALALMGGAAIMAATTLPFHWKAVRWSGLVN